MGLARAHVVGPGPGTLVLGHGAGGGVDAVDLVAVAGAAAVAGWRVVLVEQPWKVAGRKVAAPPRQLDVAWTAVVHHLREAGQVGDRLVLGGRSAGARVACRTALPRAAHGVCALAVPLHPPGRPDRSRADELAAAGVPTLVVQGRRDAFGSADAVSALGLPGVTVIDVAGDHGLKVDPGGVAAAVATWLGGLTTG